MKCQILRSRSYIFFIAFVLTLKMDDITSFDFVAKRDFVSTFLRAFPNPKPNYNTLTSPFAIRGALLATSFVARRETKEALETLLYGANPQDLMHKLTDLKDENGWKVRLFVNKDTDVSICVKNKTSDFLEYVDYGQKSAQNAINAWVLKRSENVIPDLQNPIFSKTQSFVTLVHIEYLAALWKKRFVGIIPANTKINGKKLSRPMLYQENEFLYGNLTDLNAEAVVLPLDDGAEMLILRPYDEDYKENFQDLKKRLQGEDIRKISSRLTNKKLSLYFPQLETVKCIRQVTNVAQNLNVTLPFQRRADFAKLHCCGEDSYVESINQHSRINADMTTLRIASQTDVRFSFADQLTTTKISAQYDDDVEEEPVAPEFSARIVVEPNEDLPKLVLRRFFYAVIKDDTTLFVGTIVKFHNIEEARYKSGLYNLI